MANRLDYDAARPLSFMFAMASRSAYGPFLEGCNAIDPSSPKRRSNEGGRLGLRLCLSVLQHSACSSPFDPEE